MCREAEGAPVGTVSTFHCLCEMGSHLGSFRCTQYGVCEGTTERTTVSFPDMWSGYRHPSYLSRQCPGSHGICLCSSTFVELKAQRQGSVFQLLFKYQ
jgi:hypothetical protein